MSSLYQRFLSVCARWPKNETRSASMVTLLDHMQKVGKKQFTHGDATQLEDPGKCARTVECLERIADDHYKKEYPRKTEATYSGFTADFLTQGIDELLKNSTRKNN